MACMASCLKCLFHHLVPKLNDIIEGVFSQHVSVARPNIAIHIYVGTINRDKDEIRKWNYSVK